jgi:formylmethanofuran dehydrogenase subunit D
MSAKEFILIAGRTARQGCGISEGKQTEGYLADTRAVQMSPEDMSALGLSDGQRIRLKAHAGEAELPVRTAKGGEVPPGVLFIAYGDLSSRLMAGDTHGSGMPTSKGIGVTLETDW